MVIWSATRIDVANYCRMRYWLKYVEKEESLRLSSYAKGTLIHDAIDKFWDRLGSESEIRRNKEGKVVSKKKYSNPEEFADHVQRMWMRTIISDEQQEDPKKRIAWRYDEEKWKIYKHLSGICEPLFDFLVEEGEPLESEIKFDFALDGWRFAGRIDHIRMENGKVILRDIKSGNPWIGEMKLKHDPQLTLYNAAFCAMCYQDERFARRFGVSNERRKQYMGNPLFVEPELDLEFFMLEALSVDGKKVRTVPKAIHKTKRRNEHFLELLKILEGTERVINSGDVYPERGRKCDSCDLRSACEQRLETIASGIHMDKKTGQLSLSLVNPEYIRKIERGKQDLAERQKQKPLRLAWKHGIKAIEW